jgi:hypothetical protein
MRGDREVVDVLVGDPPEERLCHHRDLVVCLRLEGWPLHLREREREREREEEGERERERERELQG